MPTTILKIEHGTTDGRGRFHPASGTPLGRTVTRVGKANPTRVKRALARWDTDSDPSNPGWVVDVEFRDGSQITYGAAPSVYDAGPRTSKQRVVTETLKWEGLMATKGKANPTAASLKALLGSGQWRKVKVRPIGEGKVQVLLTTGKGRGRGRLSANPRKVTVYEESNLPPYGLVKIGSRVLQEGGYVSVGGERWSIKQDRDAGVWVLDQRAPKGNPRPNPRRGSLSGKRTGRGNPGNGPDKAYEIRDPFSGSETVYGPTLAKAIKWYYDDFDPWDRPTHVWYKGRSYKVPGGKARPTQ